MDIENFPKYCYSMRVDNSHNEVVETKIIEFCNNNDFTSYLFAREHKEDGTPHYQGCLWIEKEITKKKTLALRQQILRKLVYKFTPKGNYSFKIARNPKNLAKYCNDKEGNGVITNLDTEKRELLGKWKIQETKTEKLAKKKELLKQKLEALTEEATTRTEFFHKSIEAYADIYDNLPRASQVEYWLYKYASTPQQRSDLVRRKYRVIGGMDWDDELQAADNVINQRDQLGLWETQNQNVKLQITDYAVSNREPLF